MLRSKRLIYLFALAMMLTIVGAAVVSADNPNAPLREGSCRDFNCGTQTCLMFQIAFCIGDGLSWHSGY